MADRLQERLEKLAKELEDLGQRISGVMEAGRMHGHRNNRNKEQNELEKKEAELKKEIAKIKDELKKKERENKNSGGKFEPLWDFRPRYGDYVPVCPKCKSIGSPNPKIELFHNNYPIKCEFRDKQPDYSSQPQPKSGGGRRRRTFRSRSRRLRRNKTRK